MYDMEYIKKITLFGDLKIIMKTIVKVCQREGIAEEGMATSEDLGDYLLHKHLIVEEYYFQKQSEALEMINL